MRAGAIVLTGVAVMAPASLPAPRELSNDLDVFRAESFGRLAACCGLLLALRCVRGRGGRPIMAAAAATFAVAALTHLVPALVALAALAALALLDRSPSPSRSRKLGRAAAIAAAAAAIWAVMLVAAGGSLGLQRVTGGAGYPASLAPDRPHRLLRPPAPGRAAAGADVHDRPLDARGPVSRVDRRPPGGIRAAVRARSGGDRRGGERVRAPGRGVGAARPGDPRVVPRRRVAGGGARLLEPVSDDRPRRLRPAPAVRLCGAFVRARCRRDNRRRDRPPA